MNNFFKFPTGEVHCKLNSNGSSIVYVPMMPNINDWLMATLMACEANSRLRKEFDVLIPYLPYSRQDRVTSREEPFSLKVIGKMINQVTCSSVITLDVHSDVAFACIDNLVNIETPLLYKISDKKEKTLVIPDQGAFKKLSKVTDEFADYAICVKKRDTDTGHLKIETIVGEVNGKDCIILDDICDGGMTFILLTQELLRLGARSVDLAVTHGIFSKGVEVLFDAGIQRVYTTDSFPQTKRTCLLVYPIVKDLSFTGTI